jgi:hypothetical protein
VHDNISDMMHIKKACHPHGNVSSEYTKWIWETKVLSLWKSGNVLPIPKKNTAQVTDLWQISLTSTINKILNSLVFRSVLKQIVPHINRYQYENTTKCSTILALNHMIYHVRHSSRLTSWSSHFQTSFPQTKRFIH